MSGAMPRGFTLGLEKTDPFAIAIMLAAVPATAADVTNVVVGGRTVVRDGRHVSFDVAAELHASITELLDAR